ncbi:hypothetical protein F4009_05950 [Candidatus Poribacteria bacterium]|nr:hypothetical protein [Candidatus Poribacteria bacterium]MYK93532.1 hypothetical protein [Candidatus Poribacteria bacterium]
MGYIYKITNTINNKSYIGISIHEPEKGRIKDHLSARGNQRKLIFTTFPSVSKGRIYDWVRKWSSSYTKSN